MIQLRNLYKGSRESQLRVFEMHPSGLQGWRYGVEADAGAEARKGLIIPGFTNHSETPVKDEEMIDLNMAAKVNKKKMQEAFQWSKKEVF